MTQRARIPIDGNMPGGRAMQEGETVQQRLIREEAEEQELLYVPTMSDAEIDAFIAELHDNRDDRKKEQRGETDSVNLLRENREARSEELYQRSRDACRR
jgi:hypothetical protein